MSEYWYIEPAKYSWHCATCRKFSDEYCSYWIKLSAFCSIECAHKHGDMK